MSTPAAAALSGTSAATPAPGAGGAPGGAAAVQPGAGGGGAGPAGGGASNQPFFDSWLPAAAPENKDTRDWLANKNFADPATLVKSYRAIETEASTLRSAANLKGYPVDKVDPTTGAVTKADENQVKAWRTTMGVPETADKYEIPLPSTNPYPQFAQFMKEGMLEANVPAAMAPRLAAVYEAAVAKMETQLRAQEDTQSQAKLLELQNSWGSAYQERVALAGRGKEWLAKEVGGLNEVQLRTMEAVLGTDKFMTAMWQIGAGNKEASFAGGNGNPAGFANSASEARAQYDQLQADRAAGKVTTEVYRKRERELAETIAAGFPAAVN